MGMWMVISLFKYWERFPPSSIAALALPGPVGSVQERENCLRRDEMRKFNRGADWFKVVLCCECSAGINAGQGINGSL